MRTAVSRVSSHRAVTPDRALDDALACIAQLSARLRAVGDLHGPRRTLLGAHVCRACARPFPCATNRAAQPGTSQTAP